MDPQVKSMLTSAALALAGIIAGYAVHVGLITPADQSSLASVLVAVGSGVAGLLVAKYKSSQLSQSAMIQTINQSDNGVKVVAAIEPAKLVNGPLK